MVTEVNETDFKSSADVVDFDSLSDADVFIEAAENSTNFESCREASECEYTLGGMEQQEVGASIAELEASDTEITVLASSNSAEKRKWDKYDVFVFCLQGFPKLPVHFQRYHEEEFELKNIFSYPIKSKKRNCY